MARHWLAVLVATVALGVAAYVAEGAQPPAFESAAQLEFGGGQRRALDPGQPAPAAPGRLLNNRIGHMRSQAVLDRASERLGGAVGREELAGSIEILADPDRVDTVTILARSHDPERVAAIANAVAEAYQEVASERERQRMGEAVAELDQTIQRLEIRLDELGEQSTGERAASGLMLQRRSTVTELIALTTRRERLATAAVLADAGVTAFDPAPYGWQTGPSPRRMGGLGAFLGLALASAYAYWREGHAGAARSAEDARAALGAPLLAHLPQPLDRRWRWRRMWRKLIAPRNEPYQFLGVAVDRALSWLPAANVLVAGVRPSRSGVAAALNTAIALCQDHRRVLLIDADLRNRRLTSAWRLDAKLGLADLNDRAVSINQATVVAGTGKDSTWSFMPAGRPRDPFSSIRGPALQRVLAEVEGARSGDETLRIVVHAPAVLEAADAGAIAPLLDGVVLIVDKGTRLDDVVGAGEVIDAAGGRLLGFAFVGGRKAARKQVSSHGRRRPVTRSPVPVR